MVLGRVNGKTQLVQALREQLSKKSLRKPESWLRKQNLKYLYIVEIMGKYVRNIAMEMTQKRLKAKFYRWREMDFPPATLRHIPCPKKQ